MSRTPRKLSPPPPDGEFDDNPEWTEQDFANAVHFDGKRKLKDIPVEEFLEIMRRGPQRAPKKVAVSLRLSPDVVKHFKDGGPGWQTRIDEALRKVAKLKKAG